MNRIVKQNSALLISVMIAVAWCVIILLVCDLSRLGLLGWFSFIYVPLSFGIGYLACAVTHRLLLRGDAGTVAIPTFYTVLFLGISVAVNTVFLVMRLSDLDTILMIIDILLLVAYLSIMLCSAAYLSSLKNKGFTVDRKTEASAHISNSLKEIIALTENAQEKAALLKLIEAVDLSTNTSQRMSESLEAEMGIQLMQLRSAILEKKETPIILKLITDAALVWHRRNVSLS